MFEHFLTVFFKRMLTNCHNTLGFVCVFIVVNAPLALIKLWWQCQVLLSYVITWPHHPELLYSYHLQFCKKIAFVFAVTSHLYNMW